jgi:tetratricopeptide (TPR) repeat protein
MAFQPGLAAGTRRQALAVCGLLLLAVAMVFVQTVRYGFVNLDDGEYVSENLHIFPGLSMSGIAWVFSHAHAANWHPVTGMSHMLDCQIYGLRAGGHHLTNVLLHAATAIALFLLLRQITGSFWPAALVAALFAVHPLRVESVAWIAERKDVLSGLCFVLILGTYVWYVRGPASWHRYLPLAVLFAMGLMAKPMLVTVPALLLVLDYWPLGRMAGSPLRRREGGGPRSAGTAAPSTPVPLARLVLEKVPLLVLVGVCCGMTMWAQGKFSAFDRHVAPWWRIANALVSYVLYLIQFVYPVGLAAFYPRPQYGLPLWQVLGALVLLVSILAAGLRWRRRCPYLLVGWLWYLGMLVPVSGIAQVGSQRMADRYTYLPQIGVYIALAWGIADICRGRPRCCRLLGIGSALVLAVLMGCAWRQTSFWRDSETLWRHALACTSENSEAENSLGADLAMRDRFDEAIAHYQTALRFRPDYMEAHANLGAALSAQGRWEEAVSHCRKAVEIKSYSAMAHNNLGAALAGQGRGDEAVRWYEKALDLDPDYLQAGVNLVSLLTAQGRLKEAAAARQKILERTPNQVEVHDSLGNALGRLGRIEEAMAEYRNALAIKPDDVEACINLGYVLTCLGRFDEAMPQYQKALEIQPETVELQNDVAMCLAGQGRFDQAVAHYRKALQIKPDYMPARSGLARTLAAQGHASDAIAEYEAALRSEPGGVEIHAELGNLLLRLGRRNEAAAHYRSVVKLSPGNPLAWNNLGVALAGGGRFDEALAAFQQALQRQPDCVEAQKNLAWLRATCPLASLRNGGEAMEHARRADQLCGGKRADVLDVLAAAYAEAGRFPEALGTARKALDLAARQKAASMADVLRTRIALYEAGKPLHEPPGR